MPSLFGARDSLCKHLSLLLTTTITAPLRTRCSPFFFPTLHSLLPASSSACTRKLPAQRVAPLSGQLRRRCGWFFSPTHAAHLFFAHRVDLPAGTESLWLSPILALRAACAFSLQRTLEFHFSPGLRSTLGTL